MQNGIIENYDTSVNYNSSESSFIDVVITQAMRRLITANMAHKTVM